MLAERDEGQGAVVQPVLPAYAERVQDQGTAVQPDLPAHAERAVVQPRLSAVLARAAA